MKTMSPPRVLNVGQMTAPCLRLDVEMSGEVAVVPPRADPCGARCVWLLVSVHTEVIGSLIVEIPEEGLTAEELTAAILSELGGEILPRLDGAGLGEPPLPDFLARRRDVLEKAPKMTVVVCTRERPEGLEACLKSLLAQEYPDFSVLVVDNAPVTEGSKSVVDRLSSPKIRYIVEPRKGLSRARNKALEVVSDGIVAWIDDDEIADPHWLAELARGFYDHPEADAVGGVMVPGELETSAQVWFEQYGGFNKHRGFVPAVFSPDTARLQSPLFPLPPFGTGGNMAFRLSALARIGPFDVALGAGSPCMGGEDTRAFTELLCAGGTVVYQPTALTRHFHRRSIEELTLQMRGYGVGLTAFYTSLVLTRPRRIPELVRLVPTAFRDVLGKESLRSGALPSDFPKELLKANRKGALVGPLRYIRARLDGPRFDKPHGKAGLGEG
jgi:glycosyltransferase involved in cell wall biosynthesis